ncbi:MAG: TRAP transporter small permease subunit [Hyphomicrobiaceae bacterium]|nr:TRAP transporter small permease subunit [Hyphomicrobiaceae bacterium]
MNAVKSIADGLDWFIDRVGRITGWCAFALVCVMAFNVLLRYFFRTGSVAMQELEWHLMAPICLLGLSYALLHDGHVKVDILYGRFPYRVQKIIDLVSMILVCLVVGLLAYLSLPYVEQSYSIGEKSPDPGGLTNRWILKSLLPIGFSLLLIQSVAATLRAYIALVEPPPPIDPMAQPALGIVPSAPTVGH